MSPLQRLRLIAQDEFLDLAGRGLGQRAEGDALRAFVAGHVVAAEVDDFLLGDRRAILHRHEGAGDLAPMVVRSEEHTSELQSLMRISYAFFCLKKKIIRHQYV